VEVTLEEWTASKSSTVGRRLANERGFTWFNVGTPHQPEFKTYSPLFLGDSLQGIPYLFGALRVCRDQILDK
jgi:hypothetical protein